MSSFTEGQQRFIELWATPPYQSLAGTAKRAGLTPDTIYTYRRDVPGFTAACDAARKATMDEARELVRAELVDALPLARKAIEQAMRSRDPGAKVRASIWAIEYVAGKAPDKLEHSGSLDIVSQLERVLHAPLPDDAASDPSG